MRYRFFFIILATLILAAIGFNGVTIYFFRNQRIDLIDRQIDRSARILLDSKAFRNSVDDGAERIENVITDVLGAERIGKVFIVRDRAGNIEYQSYNMSPLQAELPTSPEWITVQAKEQYVRIFNARINPAKTLQVGLVLDQNFVNWSIIDARTVLFIAGLLFGIFAISALLTLVLLSPIRILSSHLSGATSDLKNLKDVDRLPRELIRFTGGFWARSDEFSTLIRAVQKLIDRINQNYKLTRSWTLQMAHELKTPLAIIRSETDSQAKYLPKTYLDTVTKEIDWTSNTIEQFLSWAELENARPNKTLNVLRMSMAVDNAKFRAEKFLNRKIDIYVRKDFSVAASPGHLDQLVMNLLTNALKFSPPGGNVFVEIKDHTLIVKDEGPGISEEVIERIGEPFNIGGTVTNSGMKGTGLGLAWVSTVAKLYGWKLNVSTSRSGTTVQLEFPKLD